MCEGGGRYQRREERTLRASVATTIISNIIIDVVPVASAAVVVIVLSWPRSAHILCTTHTTHARARTHTTHTEREAANVSMLRIPAPSRNEERAMCAVPWGKLEFGVAPRAPDRVGDRGGERARTPGGSIIGWCWPWCWLPGVPWRTGDRCGFCSTGVSAHTLVHAMRATTRRGGNAPGAGLRGPEAAMAQAH